MNNFLTLEDYQGVCDDYEYRVISGNSEARETAEAAALEQVASYIRHRYDVAAAFAASGTDRNYMLVQCVVNISLWLMVHRLPQNMGHERRECLYNDAVKWLRDIQAGKASPDLPTYKSEDGADDDTRNPIRAGSMRPNVYDW